MYSIILSSIPCDFCWKSVTDSCMTCNFTHCFGLWQCGKWISNVGEAGRKKVLGLTLSKISRSKTVIFSSFISVLALSINIQSRLLMFISLVMLSDVILSPHTFGQEGPLWWSNAASVHFRNPLPNIPCKMVIQPLQKHASKKVLNV